MSQDDQKLSVRSRRALHCLQYSPNGKDVVGLSPRKPRLGLQKKVDANIMNSPLTKGRTSISLPDMSLKSISSKAPTIRTLMASTPVRNDAKTASVSSSTALATAPVGKSSSSGSSRKNISVIIEEKENPSLATERTVSINAARVKPAKLKSVDVQCDLVDELMVTGADVNGTPYWKLMAHKRFAALLETDNETKKVLDRRVLSLLF